jgi:hypothetical protein
MKIRSFDFEPIPGRSVCYIEGDVLRTDDTFAYFRPTLRVWGGTVADHLDDLPEEMRTPLPGHLSSEWDGRVTMWED